MDFILIFIMTDNERKSCSLPDTVTMQRHYLQDDRGSVMKRVTSNIFSSSSSRKSRHYISIYMLHVHYGSSFIYSLTKTNFYASNTVIGFGGSGRQSFKLMSLLFQVFQLSRGYQTVYQYTSKKVVR